MKALQVKGPNEIELLEVPSPDLEHPDDVLVAVCYSGICGTDLSILKGEMGLIRDGKIRYPVRIGHEWSGIVVKTGSEVTAFKAGDRVVSDNFVSCGKCEVCLSGQYNQCRNSRSLGTVNCWDGSFSEYILIPARHLYHLPDRITLDEAALIEPATIGLNGLLTFPTIREQTLIVTGTGAIGLASVSMAKVLGAKKVILLGRKEGKLSLGRTMGADAVINTTHPNMIEKLAEITSGNGADILLETSGSIGILRDAPALVRDRAVIASLAFYDTAMDHFEIDTYTTRGLELRGVHSHSNMINQVIDMMAERQINLKPMITHTFSLEKSIDVFMNIHLYNEIRIKILIKICPEMVPRHEKR